MLLEIFMNRVYQDEARCHDTAYFREKPLVVQLSFFATVARW